MDISNFLPNTLPKIHRVREMIEQINSGFDLEVDGGIDAETGPLAAAAGANVLVSGTAVFGENELVSTAMDRLRASIKQWQKTASGGQVRRSRSKPELIGSIISRTRRILGRVVGRKLLMSKTRVDRHHQHLVDILQDLLKHRHRGGRVDDHPSPFAPVP